jgi:vacuolar protein sorting-associated protein 35
VDAFRKSKKVNDLYELVQYAGNIIPRLYLLVTVGAVYIKAKQVPTKDIMKDLVEMCRGVQHPLRGLFLRNYLLQSIKRELPEDSVESKHGTINDSIDFILLNFSEMNKLWVRMQHQGHTRDKAQREKERRELRILVGTNLVRISSLEGVTSEMYKDKILPAVMQQIVGCKDPIAQEYLMECIIQVFPDELHLQTLDVFLEPCGKLHPKVNVKNIIIALMDRLASFSLSETAGESEALKEMHDKLFEMFSAQIALTIKGRPDMPIEDVVALQHSLVNLALKCYPGRIDYVDQVLAYTCTALKEVGKLGAHEINHSTPVFNPLMKLLQLPAESTSVSMVLKFEHYVPLIEFLGYDLRKELACFSIQSLVQNDVKLTAADEVSTFLDIVDPLIQDQPDQNLEEEDEDEFSEEQCLVGRMIQCFKGSTPDLQYTILSATRKRLGTGAGCERRIKRTLPAIIFQGLELVLQYNKMTAEDDSAAEAKMAKIFKFLHQTITALSKAEFTDLALRMFLQAALTSDQTAFAKSEDITYEFMNQAFSLYEDDVADSKAQIDAITLIIATLERLTIFGEENFTPFATKSALVASKLMRKVDQAKGVCLCSFVFWSNQLELAKNSDDAPDGKQVRQCLTKALKVANSCMEPAEQVKLFVEIFNYYIIFYEKKCTAIKLEDLNKLVVLIRENIGSVEGDEAATIKTYFENALLHIKNAKSGESSVSYEGFEG